MIQPSAHYRGASSADRKGVRRTSAKAVQRAVSDKPVQLTFSDYAASLGFKLLPDAS